MSLGRDEKPILEATVSQRQFFNARPVGPASINALSEYNTSDDHRTAAWGSEYGRLEDEYGTKLRNLERNGNAMGFSASRARQVLAKQEFPVFDGSQEYCLWLGCMGADSIRMGGKS